MKLVLLSKYRSILILFRIAIGLMLLSFFVFNHCAPLAIETAQGGTQHIHIRGGKSDISGSEYCEK